jgi:hypothetical protein
MNQVPQQVPTQRRWRPQFSPRSVLMLMTLCAIGAWYWCQRPYRVERTRGPTEYATFLPRPVHSSYPRVQGGREVEYVRRLWGGKTVRQGVRRDFDGSDKLVVVENYRNGQLHGQFAEYFSTGEPRRRETYVQGRLHGTSGEWDRHGSKIFEGNYEHGARHGRFQQWNSNGALSVEAFFDHDQPAAKWTWHPIDVLARQSGNNAYKAHTITGQWRARRPDALWEWRDAKGGLYLTASFGGSSPAAITLPSNLGPRVIEALIERCRERPDLLLWPFDHEQINFRGQSLKAFLVMQQDLMRLPIFVNARSLAAAGAALDANVTYEAHEKPLLLALCEILAPRELGCDWRYGALYIDKDRFSHWCLLCPNSSMSSQPSAPAMTANTASVRISPSKCRFVRSIRGSTISEQHSTSPHFCRATAVPP